MLHIIIILKEKVESFDIDPNQEHKYIEQLEDMKSDIYDIKDVIIKFI